MAFDADYDHVLTMQARRGRLDWAIEAMAADSAFHLHCAKGVLPARCEYLGGLCVGGGDR